MRLQVNALVVRRDADKGYHVHSVGGSYGTVGCPNNPSDREIIQALIDGGILLVRYHSDGEDMTMSGGYEFDDMSCYDDGLVLGNILSTYDGKPICQVRELPL